MARALVTGGTRGIGRAIMDELTQRGHECFTFSRSPNDWFVADATNHKGRSSVKEHVGYCDILVNNVGGGGRYGTDEEVFAKNVTAMIDFTQWALGAMSKRGRGRIITISSIHALEYGSRPIFMAAKAAQIAYMKGTSKLVGCLGITCNTVCPGNVRVEGKPEIASASSMPLWRMGKPVEVAKLVAFLCSEDAAWINGSCITIDGGESNAI